MDYKIKINEFEGPLDLLLHLIKQSEIEIWDIKINDITKQYMEYIKAMENMNLDVASEYLIMAAELIEIKSRLLLPKQIIDEDDEFEEDPKEKLINKLLEYKKYKEVSNEFKSLEETRQFIFTKPITDLKDYEEPTKKKDAVGITNLLDAFQDFLERQNLKKPLTTKITKKDITILQRRKSIKKILTEKKKIKFEELFDRLDKSYIITTFLAILEMSKNNEIEIKQKNNFDSIYLNLKEGDKVE